MKAKKDRVQIIVESVMSEPIPEQGQLINPFKKQRKSSKQVTLDDMLNKRGPQELPENVELAYDGLQISIDYTNNQTT